MKDEHISSNGPPHPIYLFIFFRILSIFNIHTHGKREENLKKKTYSGVYLKGPN